MHTSLIVGAGAAARRRCFGRVVEFSWRPFPDGRATRASAWILWGTAVIVGAAGMVGRAIELNLVHYLDEVIVLGWLVLHFVGFAFVGLCVAAPVAARFMERGATPIAGASPISRSP